MTRLQPRDLSTTSSPSKPAAGARSTGGDRYERPAFEIISLDCEISSYAPDGDDGPLF